MRESKWMGNFRNGLQSNKLNVGSNNSEVGLHKVVGKFDMESVSQILLSLVTETTWYTTVDTSSTNIELTK